MGTKGHSGVKAAKRLLVIGRVLGEGGTEVWGKRDNKSILIKKSVITLNCLYANIILN